MGSRISHEKVALPQETVAIVTGASAGVGYETAKGLAMMGAKVVLACRNEDKTNKAMQQIRDEVSAFKSSNPEEDLPSELQLHYMHLDLASLKSTHKFIDDFKALGWPLHLLICNAGMVYNEMKLTEDNHETLFQVNYLGHVLIVEHLIPILKASGDDSRVILVSSDSQLQGGVNKNDIEGKTITTDNSFKLYSNSKLYQVIHMFKLLERFEDVKNLGIFSLHPGFVETDIFNNLSPFWRRFVKLFSVLKINKEKGAYTSLHCAVHPDLKGQSGYYSNCKPSKINSTARNKECQNLVWAHTMNCLEGYLPLTSDEAQSREGE